MAKWFLLFSALFTMPVLADQDEARQLLHRGEIVPLEQLIRQANELVPGKVIEIELEHENSRLFYEMELLDKNGQVWEFLFDARTGELLKKERED